MSNSKQNQGMIYVVATPIGNLDDISQRALTTLAQVDLIAAEDTRHSKRLLDHFHINTAIISLHEHNEREIITKLLFRLENGENLALISDAGTPLVSDPGFHLIDAARKANIKIVPIPGACAAITALSAAGLPSDRFCFEGFLPATKQQRQKRLQELITEARTLIFYEAPHRIVAMLSDIQEVFGSQRIVVLARELTKVYETIVRDTAENLLQLLSDDEKQQRGEFVVLVQAEEKKLSDTENNAEILRLLKILLAELPLKKAVNIATEILSGRKNEIYKLALQLKAEQ